MRYLVNIDVPEPAPAIAFYTPVKRVRGMERLAMHHFSEPFGHGFCLNQFAEETYGGDLA